MALHLQTLGSSSGGNCTLLWSEGGAVLVDFGFGPRFIAEGLQRNGLTWDDIRAVLVTHIHSDHVDASSMRLFARRRIPVIAPSGVVGALKRAFRFEMAGMETSLHPFSSKKTLELGPFLFTAFEVPHDSPGGCYGYRVSAATTDGKKQVSIATDLGYADDGLAMEFAASDLIVVESNHDPMMLENSGRPAWLKQRIRDIGHLSNPQSADLISRILSLNPAPPQAILLAHLSQECNTEPLALASMQHAIDELGFPGIAVEVSHALEPSACLSAHDN